MRAFSGLRYKKMIYLDNAAATMVYPEINRIISEYNMTNFFNPSAQYAKAAEISAHLAAARRVFGEYLRVDSNDIYFTSGATESNNWALKCGYKNLKKSLVVSAGEHSSVFETAQSIKNKGADVKFIPITPDGCIEIDSIKKTVNENTALVSIIHVSNETGVINNVAAIAKEIKHINPAAIVHCDGVQALGKIRPDLSNIDMYSMSAHKIHGPKGVGALYIKAPLKLSPLIHGGGQQNGLRSGTDNVSGAIAFGAALKQYQSEYNADYIKKLRNQFLSSINGLTGIRENAPDSNIGNILLLTIDGCKGETLQHMLEEYDVIIGLGSACSARAGSNRVFAEMGMSKAVQNNIIRVSFDMSNDLMSVKTAAEKLCLCVNALRSKLKN